MSKDNTKLAKGTTGSMLGKWFGDDWDNFWSIRSIEEIYEDADKVFSALDGQLIPAMDIVEKDDKLVATLEMPGLAKENVNVEIQDDKLIIFSKKDELVEKEDEKGHVISSERRTGSYRREMYVGPNMNSDEIEAKLENGVLTIVMPKPQKKPDHTKKVTKINIR